jgi:hypothetical protein
MLDRHMQMLDGRLGLTLLPFRFAVFLRTGFHSSAIVEQWQAGDSLQLLNHKHAFLLSSAYPSQQSLHQGWQSLPPSITLVGDQASDGSMIYVCLSWKTNLMILISAVPARCLNQYPGVGMSTVSSESAQEAFPITDEPKIQALR